MQAVRNSWGVRVGGMKHGKFHPNGRFDPVKDADVVKGMKPKKENKAGDEKAKNDKA
jgi:hypothetical protein